MGACLVLDFKAERVAKDDLAAFSAPAADFDLREGRRGRKGWCLWARPGGKTQRRPRREDVSGEVRACGEGMLPASCTAVRARCCSSSDALLGCILAFGFGPQRARSLSRSSALSFMGTSSADMKGREWGPYSLTNADAFTPGERQRFWRASIREQPARVVAVSHLLCCSRRRSGPTFHPW